MLSSAHIFRDLGIGYKTIVFMTRKGPTSVMVDPDLATHFGVAWTMLDMSRREQFPFRHNPTLQALFGRPLADLVTW